MSTFILEEVDRMQADAFATDVRGILVAHGDEMAENHVNTLESVLQILESWADERSGMDGLEAWSLNKALAGMPDLIPHWSDV